MRSIILILFVLSNVLNAQTGTLKGTVSGNDTNEKLAGANISISETHFNTTSNYEGIFLINNIPSDNYTLTISHVGYKTKSLQIEVFEGTTENLEIVLETSPVALGEITVKSTKSDKLVREIALPMEVVSANRLDENSYISVSDALRSQAGVAIARDGIWATHVNIRGLSRHNIVTLVDGNRIETSTALAAGLSLIDINDVERIEVIKGGASSLYGTGATGGVVNIQTKEGFYNNTFHLSGSMMSGYNSVNNGALGNLSFNAGAENWFARVSGTMRSADNTETPEGTLENSQFHDNNISAMVGFIPFEDHELQINFQEFNAKDVGIPGGNAFPATASARYVSEKRNMYSAEYRVNNLFPSLAMASIKYFHQFIDRQVELVPNANVTVTPGATHTVDGVQFQSNWLFGKTHFVIAGVDFWQREYNGHREQSIKSLNKVVGDFPVPISTFRSLGIFAQDEIKLIADKLSLTVGGRFDRINITSEETDNPAYIIVNGVRNDNPPANPQASFAAADTDNISWSGNIGMIYTLMSDVDLTLNVARTFRSPNLEERFQYINLGGDIYLGNPDLEPEKGYFFDAGVRVWNPVFSFRGNLFFNSFNNLVIDKEIIADSLFVKNNVGEARLYGFDLSLEYNFYKDFVLYSSLAFVRGEDTENNVDLPEIPPFNGRLGIRANVTDFLKADLAATFFSSQKKVAPGEETTPGFTTFDIYLTTVPIDISLAKLQLFAGVENITDRLYRNHLATNRGLIRTEPGRNIFVKIKLSW